MSDVHGGTGQAALASIYSRDLFTHDAANSLSGIGATLIGTINLPKFNLLAGGTIDVTSGINNLALNSVGPNTQIQLRQIPPARSPRRLARPLDHEHDHDHHGLELDLGHGLGHGKRYQ